ncbi:MAG: 1-acyl-sn-glycerol-3-phosphate acyltransferase [Oligoflexus sp.]
MSKNLSSLAGRAFFKLRGWNFAPLPPFWQDKQVIIGFPHTTVLDTVMAFAGFSIVKKKGHVLVKSEAFRWPFAALLNKLGAIPVDRNAKAGLVAQMVEEFQKRDEFHLSLVPEGTRHGVSKLKTGFWHIAKAAKVPIVCWYLDNENKRTVWAGQVWPSESLDEDLKKIKQLYAQVGYHIQGIAERNGESHQGEAVAVTDEADQKNMAKQNF